jgi:hypothetical protein
VREQRTLGSVRGAASNGRPYRDSLGFAGSDHSVLNRTAAAALLLSPPPSSANDSPFAENTLLFGTLVARAYNHRQFALPPIPV